MLVLTRKKDQQLFIRLGDETVIIRVLSVDGVRVRLGVIADRSIAVHREEVALRIQEEATSLQFAPAL